MKKLIYLLLLFLAASNVLAQLVERDSPHRSMSGNFYAEFVKPSKFIFEASIVKVNIVTENERFFKVNHLKVHKVFKGNLKFYELIYKYEIDSADRAYFLKNADPIKKFNHFDGTGIVSLYFLNDFLNNEKGIQAKQFTNNQIIIGLTYYLNFDTYTYSDKSMLVKEKLRFGQLIQDTNEVGFSNTEIKFNKVKNLYDTLLKYQEIGLLYDDGSIFRQMTAKDWLETLPGMRPNIFKNIAEPIPLLEVYKPTDPEVLKQNEEDLKKAIEFHKKMSKHLRPKEKRKKLKQQKNNATLRYFMKNEYYL